MRLALRLLGTEVLALVWGDEGPDDEDIATTADLRGSTGGEFERAAPFGDPDLDAGGNGYHATGPRIGFGR